MSSVVVTTIVRMIESLPESTQMRVAEHLRECLTDMSDEKEWDDQWEKSQDQLITTARRAKQQIAEQKSESMDFNRP